MTPTRAPSLTATPTFFTVIGCTDGATNKVSQEPPRRRVRKGIDTFRVHGKYSDFFTVESNVT